ncbi:hypothetical protein KEM56_004726, partial [Ascosphaera pollenicola]
MAAELDNSFTDVPGTVFLVDDEGDMTNSRRNGDIVLVPQPTNSPADPLNWPRLKKFWCLALISAYACVNSYGENNWGAAWTTISQATGLTIGQMNGG